MGTMVLVYKNLQNWAMFEVNVGKYSSTMEHLGQVVFLVIESTLTRLVPDFKTQETRNGLVMLKKPSD
jgi:hypothetical protein